MRFYKTIFWKGTPEKSYSAVTNYNSAKGYSTHMFLPDHEDKLCFQALIQAGVKNCRGEHDRSDAGHYVLVIGRGGTVLHRYSVEELQGEQKDQ